MMPVEHYRLVEICSLNDSLLLPWLDLYELSFPQVERIPVSRILNVLHEQQRGISRGQRLLAAVPAAPPPSLIGDGFAGLPVMGILFTFEPRDLPAAFLWYFAVQPGLRGNGLGGRLYRDLLAQLGPQARALIFDLEDPRKMETPAEQEQARHRVGFYRRLGARLLGGIDYSQQAAPHLPCLPLLLMAHPLQELTPQEAYDLAKAAMPQAIHPAGTPRWVGTEENGF
jgi:GNAT superfamily N-acetyltransferase